MIMVVSWNMTHLEGKKIGGGFGERNEQGMLIRRDDPLFLGIMNTCMGTELYIKGRAFLRNN